MQLMHGPLFPAIEYRDFFSVKGVQTGESDSFRARVRLESLAAISISPDGDPRRYYAIQRSLCVSTSTDRLVAPFLALLL